MKKNRLEIRIRECDLVRIQKAAELAEMNVSEVVRAALRFGLPALLKFEKGSKYAWDDEAKEWSKKEKGAAAPNDENKAQETLKDSIPKEKLEKLIKIANTKWLNGNNEE